MHLLDVSMSGCGLAESLRRSLADAAPLATVFPEWPRSRVHLSARPFPTLLHPVELSILS